MKQVLFFILLLMFAFMPATRAEELPNDGQIQGGYNYFGRSIGIDYDRNLVGPLWVNFSLETGSLELPASVTQAIFLFQSGAYGSYNIGLDIHDYLTLALSIHRLDNKGHLRWLNSFALGITHFDLTYSVNFTNYGGTDVYSGQKQISAYAIYTDVHLLDFYPDDEKLFFALGIKVNTTFLSSPQSVTATDSAGNSQVTSYYGSSTGTITLPYPELFFGLGYCFE